MTWSKLMQFPDLPGVPEPFRGGSFTIIFAAFLGSEEEGRRLLAPVRELGPEVDTLGLVEPTVLGDMAMDPPDPLPYVSDTAVLGELPSEGVDALLAAAGPGTGSPLTMVEFRQLGGASRAAPRAQERGPTCPASS